MRPPRQLERRLFEVASRLSSSRNLRRRLFGMILTQLASRAKSRIRKAYLWLRGRYLIARHRPAAGKAPAPALQS